LKRIANLRSSETREVKRRGAGRLGTKKVASKIRCFDRVSQRFAVAAKIEACTRARVS